MPKSPKKTAKVVEPESDSEESTVANGDDEVEEAHESSDSESDDEPSGDDVVKKLATKLELARALRKTSWAPLRYSSAVKRVDFSKVDMKGHTKEEMQNMLKEIVKQVGYVRTLDEILDHYEKNQVAVDRKAHPDFPAPPANAFIRYMQENREKFEAEFTQKEGKVPIYSQVFKFASEKYKKLPEKKKEKFVKAYERERQEYQEKKQKFYLKHPELKSKLKSRTARQKTSEDYNVLTPFIFYWRKVSKDTKITMRDAQATWKNLSDKEKGKYVNELLHLDTEQEKKISKAELQMGEKDDGFPGIRPMNLHNLFMKKFYEKNKDTKGSQFAAASKVWSELSQKEKDKLQKELDVHVQQWSTEMELWIKKQPLQMQPGLRLKYAVNASKKRKSEAAPVVETPKKKAKKTKEAKKEDKFAYPESSEEELVVKSPKKNKKPEPEPDLESPFKEEKEDLPVIVQTTLGSPKKKKLKEPEYPSQTTAHYFMTRIYSGKPNKVSKGYNKLSAAEKSKYREELKAKKKEFLMECGSYIKSLNANEASKFQMQMKQLRAQQEDATSWHTSAGTDDEKRVVSSDSDSDSDSS